MKKLLIVALAMVAVASTCMAQEVAEAEGIPLSFDVTLDIYSSYVWRGYQVNDDPVAQPGAVASLDLGEYGSIFAGVWANYDFNNFSGGDNRADGFSELDYTLSYAIDLKDFSLEVGHIWYSYPVFSDEEYDVSTEEIFVSIAYNNDIVTPSLTVYHDYSDDDDVEGTYASVALSKDFEITEQVSASVFASLGGCDEDYADSYYGAADGNYLLDGNVGVSTSYAINDYLSVGATLVWTSVVDSDVRDVADANGLDQDMLWGGLNLAASF
ncbi:MAG: hypothetical protein PF904_02645 [Kiritimatiellae bacterium]|jgi:uncharacterized protein (TIGR02001 family)|nr:hypothetical protein [Kiritimatiellia bacterium]